MINRKRYIYLRKNFKWESASKIPEMEVRIDERLSVDEIIEAFTEIKKVIPKDKDIKLDMTIEADYRWILFSFYYTEEITDEEKIELLEASILAGESSIENIKTQRAEAEKEIERLRSKK